MAAHFSMINHVEGDTYTDEPLAFLLEDASIKEVISPYYMGRIVDFVSFIEKYPFKPSVLDREWKFRLVDPIMECNQGNFHLIISRDGHGQVMRIMEPCEDTINIQTMTTMLMATNARNILQRLDVFRQQSGRLICLRMRSSSRLRIYQIIFKIFEELLTIVCVRVILHIEQKRWTGDAVKITASPFSNVNRRWHYG